MLTYNMDVEERSSWLRATPGAAALAQPFYCTEAGNFYGRAHFATARTDKESYLLFYTLSGSGLIEQNDQGRTTGITTGRIWTARASPIWPRYCSRRGGCPPLRSVGWRCSRCLSHWPPSGSTAPPHRSKSAWPCTGCWP